MKICKTCGIEKPLDEFYKVNKKSKYHQGTCKVCTVKKQSATYCPEKGRDKNLRYNYGITIDDYNKILKEQGGVCKICQTDDPKGRKTGRGGSIDVFYVDHNHKTGKVRGLLCNTCNRAIGYIGENVNTLEQMIKYLNDHQ